MATENLAPSVISRIMGEIRDLVKNPPNGIRYTENDENSVSEIHAVIDGPEEYPNVPPRGFFLTKIFHPNVAENGDICVNTLKKDWTTDLTIKHVFQVIKCLLIVPFPESSLNCEAGKLFMESYSEFFKRAQIMTEIHALPLPQLHCDLKLSGDSRETVSSSSESAAILSNKKKVKDAMKKSLKRL